MAYYNQVQAHKRTTPATPAAPAGPDPFQNNGWQLCSRPRMRAHAPAAPIHTGATPSASVRGRAPEMS